MFILGMCEQGTSKNECYVNFWVVYVEKSLKISFLKNGPSGPGPKIYNKIVDSGHLDNKDKNAKIKLS